MDNLHMDNIHDDKHSGFRISGSTMKNVWRTLLILFVVSVFAVAIIFVPGWFASKKEGGTQHIAFSSSLISGTIQTVPADISLTIASLVKKGTAVVVTFSVENGNSLYEDTWEINQDTLDAVPQTQDRVMLFRKMKPELDAKIIAYNSALNLVPSRTFALAIDVTEGFKDGFSFQKYFSKEDLHWMRDKSKKSSIFVFSIGYNPIPGFMSWDDVNSDNIEQIEKEAQNFFIQVPHPLDSTKLLSQIHFIMNKMQEFKNSSIVIETDLLENTSTLSAYKPQSPGFKDFVSKKWTSYQKKVIDESGSPACPDVTANVQVLVPTQTAYGKQQERYAWYSAIRLYLAQNYPKAKFKYNF